MNGYQLSTEAAAAEARWERSRATSIERKAYPPVTYPGFAPGQQDGSNVRTGHVTTEQYRDSSVAVQEAATGQSATWACVSFWAGNIASLPITVQRGGPGGVPVEDTGHPLYWLLHDSPNYDQSAYDFWEFMVASIELRGNAYAEMVKRDDGFIISLNAVPPQLMSVSRDTSGALQYRWRDDAGDHLVRQENMLHIRGFGGGPLGGVSPLAVCRRTFGVALAAERAAAAMFDNGVRPTGTLSTDAKLTLEQRQDFERRLQERFVGAMNAGRPMLLDGGLKWEAISIDPHDAEMLDSRRFSVEDICRVFEVDPHLVGQTQGNTALGSSITEQTLSVLKFKLRKRLKRIEGALSKQLLTRADRSNGVAIRYNLEAFLRADSAGRSTFYQSALTSGWMTINEVRALEGLPPVPGGDVPRMQMQNVPITEAGQDIGGSNVR
jgi:HK97 family phage portal protein